jgi:hypothetical protein
MTHHTLTASLPQHIYGYVCKSILTAGEQYGFEPCVIIGITSRPSRALHFEILCESGAKWSNIPIHMLRWAEPTNMIVHPLPDLQCWDCHGFDFAVFRLEYLREMGCQYKTTDGRQIPAHYAFTLDHTDNGYSLYPPEHKNYNILLLEDGSGQIAAMPNNRIIWKDDSFVKKNSNALSSYRVMPPDTYHAEISRNPQDTAFTRDAK